MSTHLTWGILGTGRIAEALALALEVAPSASLLAVASRKQATAEAFADQFGIDRRYGTYDDLLTDGDVDAVYISLPHTMHACWSIRCAEAGKHILCEKPLGTNHSEAMAAIEAAREHDVFLMEAFMYRCHPQTARLVTLLRDGVIGEVRIIQATFGFQMGERENEFRLTNAGAGGGIMDVGCYTISISRLIAGAALGLDGPAEPVEVVGCAGIRKHDPIDEHAAAVLRFEGGIVANCVCGIRCSLENNVRIWGSEGWIEIPDPWQAGRHQARPGRIVVHRRGARFPKRIRVSPVNSFIREVENVAVHLQNRQAVFPAMSWDDSLGNMQTLDRWRRSVGLAFEVEKVEALGTTIAGRPLRRREPCLMKYGRIDGIDQPIARTVLGSILFDVHDPPFAFAMLDHYFERGGNCIDTAHIYGNGDCERAVGEWITRRNVRDQVVLLVKGAHAPDNHPGKIGPQLTESLERLQTDHADLYVLHRDNADFSVDQFIEVLNEHVRSGAIRALGASNWSPARVDEANGYARAKGLQGFSLVSNNLSLARWNEPPWTGCRTSSDPESRAWHAERQMPLVAWSSQAQGFCTGRFRPEDRGRPDCANLARAWFNDKNFKRLERARELAEARNAAPIQIALAWVLCQSFPVFPIIGPASLEEMRISMGALTIDLDPDEMHYLSLAD